MNEEFLRRKKNVNMTLCEKSTRKVSVFIVCAINRWLGKRNSHGVPLILINDVMKFVIRKSVDDFFFLIFEKYRDFENFYPFSKVLFI